MATVSVRGCCWASRRPAISPMRWSSAALSPRSASARNASHKVPRGSRRSSTNPSGGGALGAGIGHLGGNTGDAGHAQRTRRTIGDGETFSGYRLTAECPSVIPGGGKESLAGWQQVQAVIVGAACPPQRPDLRSPRRTAGIRLTARRRRCGAVRPAAGWNLVGKQRIRHLQIHPLQGVVPVHSDTPQSVVGDVKEMDRGRIQKGGDQRRGVPRPTC